MATVTALVLTPVQNILNDTGGVRWTTSELIDYVNQAIRDICAIQPEASATTANITLVAGSKQTMPAGTIKLIRIIRNMGGGSTPGDVPRQTSMQLMDWHKQTWHQDTATVVVRNWMRDDKTPRIFYVWPPSSGGNVLECEYTVLPTAIAAGGDTFPLPDYYAQAVVDYVLFRAFGKDEEIDGLAAKRDTHRALYERAMSLDQAAESSIE